jgi:hypothetical protein
MTVVLEYDSGKVEIVSFDCDGLYPQRVRIRRPPAAEKMFRWQRWLRRGKPVYAEEHTGPDAA